MKILCVLGKYGYGDPRNGLGVEYSAFTAAFENLGHQVLHFESWDRTSTADPVKLNHDLLAIVLAERPDVMITVQRDCEIWIETLQAIRTQTDTRTVTWTTDDSFKFRKVSRFIGRHYDAITTTYDYCVPMYRKEGIKNVLLTQWAANSRLLQEPISASDCHYGVTFVGAAFGERRKIIESLRAKGVQVECFGRNWPNGPVSEEDFARIIRQSFISLNFSGGYESVGLSSKQIKARTFEVPGCGGLLLTERTAGLEKYFELGREIVVFTSVDDLTETIKTLQHDTALRDTIAKAGHARTRSEHTYERRLSNILSALPNLDRGIVKTNKIVDMEHAKREHGANKRLLEVTRSVLGGVGAFVWGPERGEKAARRAVFETSWRLLGETTFTAKGLPGRLFPGT